MSKEQGLTFTTEQYAEATIGAKVFVERIEERVKKGQLTDEHLERAQHYLIGIASWKPHRRKLAVAGQTQIGVQEQDQDNGGKQPEIAKTPQFTIELSTKTLIDRSTRRAIKFSDDKDFEVMLKMATAGEEGLSAKEIIEICEQYSSKVAAPARDTIKKLRTGLMDYNSQLVIIQHGKTRAARYQLSAIVEIVENVQVQSDIDQYTTLGSTTVGARTAETKKAKPKETISLPDGQQISTLTERQKKLVETASAGSKKVPITSGELRQILYGNSVNDKIARENLDRDVYSVRKKLAASGWTIVNAAPLGGYREGMYFLAQIEEGQKREEKTGLDLPTMQIDLKSRVVSIGDRRVQIPGGQQFECLMLLAMQPQHDVESEQVAKVAKESGSKSKTPAGNVIESLRDHLEPEREGTGKLITRIGSFRGSGIRYRLNAEVSIVDETGSKENLAEKVEKPQKGEPLDLGPVVSFAGLVSTDVGEKTVIHYEPSAEELRSQMENKILNFLLGAMIPKRRIDFVELQKSLYEDQTSIIWSETGARYITIHQVDDIIGNFERGMKKIREEAEIPTLRANWTEEDRQTWDKLQMLLHRDFGDDIASFSDKVKREIRKSERKFYKEYRPTSGKKVKQIRI